MKLYNSIKALKDHLDAVYLCDRPEYVKATYEAFQANPKIKDAYITLIWHMWHGLDNSTKDKIISASLPAEEKVGGYWNITDAHIETLLKKAFCKIRLIRLLSLIN